MLSENVYHTKSNISKVFRYDFILKKNSFKNQKFWKRGLRQNYN